MKYLRNFLKYRFLIKELVSRDIKKKYRRSVLGLIWTVLNPLMMMIVMTVVFSQIFRFNIENFPVYLLCGQTIFNFFSESTSTAMNSIIQNAPLIKKVYVPHYMFPLSNVVSSVVSLLASYCALIGVVLATRTPLHYTMMLSFVPLLFVAVFSLGIGLIMSAVAVRFRDMVHLYSVFLTALMYLTPIFYPIENLPNIVRSVVEWNPLTVFVLIFRGMMLQNQLPSIELLTKGVLFCVVSLTVGLYVFYKRHDRFILYI
jgi:ABC-type polysaccharide/polyol phosphate export permease